MAFASVGTVGNTQSKTSGTTVTITADTDVEVGNLIVVVTAWDNTDTTDGETTRLSIADESSNTWVKVAEFTETVAGVAEDGITVALFVSVVGTQIDGGVGAAGDDITVTSDTARVAKAATAWEFTLDAAAVSVEAYAVDGGPANPDAISLAGMTSREYLIVHACAIERTSLVSPTYDTDYTAMTKDGTTAGASASNATVIPEFRIATLTGDTADITVTDESTSSSAQILAAIYENAGAVPGTTAVQNWQKHRWYGGQPIA